MKIATSIYLIDQVFDSNGRRYHMNIIKEFGVREFLMGCKRRGLDLVASPQNVSIFYKALKPEGDK